MDGKVSSVQTFGGTVGQVVKGANVELQPPTGSRLQLDSHVQDGSVINVNLAKAVKVSLDGAERTINTTSPTVEGLVTELGVASASRAVRARRTPSSPSPVPSFPSRRRRP